MKGETSIPHCLVRISVVGPIGKTLFSRCRPLRSPVPSSSSHILSPPNPPSKLSGLFNVIGDTTSAIRLQRNTLWKAASLAILLLRKRKESAIGQLEGHSAIEKRAVGLLRNLRRNRGRGEVFGPLCL